MTSRLCFGEAQQTNRDNISLLRTVRLTSGDVRPPPPAARRLATDTKGDRRKQPELSPSRSGAVRSGGWRQLIQRQQRRRPERHLLRVRRSCCASVGALHGCRVAGFQFQHTRTAQMLIHHYADVSQRLCEQSGGMREPWQHGTGGRADKGLREERLYRGLGSDIKRSGRSADVDALMG